MLQVKVRIGRAGVPGAQTSARPRCIRLRAACCWIWRRVTRWRLRRSRRTRPVRRARLPQNGRTWCWGEGEIFVGRRLYKKKEATRGKGDEERDKDLEQLSYIPRGHP